MLQRFNRAVDEDLKIVASTAFTTTATSTPVAIGSVGSGDEDLGIMLNVTLLDGTHDGSNYYTVDVKAGETSGGTFYTVASILSTDTELGANLLSINTREIVDAVGSTDAAYYEVTVTKTGSTATGITLSAHFVKGV